MPAATFAQKLKTQLLLKVPMPRIEKAFETLDALDAAERDAVYEKLDEALTEAEGDKFDTTLINAGGANISPERARKLLKEYVATLIRLDSGQPGTIIV